MCSCTLWISWKRMCAWYFLFLIDHEIFFFTEHLFGLMLPGIHCGKCWFKPKISDVGIYKLERSKLERSWEAFVGMWVYLPSVSSPGGLVESLWRSLVHPALGCLPWMCVSPFGGKELESFTFLCHTGPSTMTSNYLWDWIKQKVC